MNITFLLAAGLIAALALLPLVKRLLGADSGSEAERDAHRARAALAAARNAGVISAEEHQAKLAALPAVEPSPATATAPRLALGLVVLVPVLALLLYRQLGTPAALEPVAAPGPHAAATAAGAAAGVATMDMDSALAKLAARLQAEPDDAEGWRLLSRGYASQQRYAEALAAAQKALELLPGDIDAEVELIEATALASPDRQFAGAPLERLDAILQRAPDHPRALWLSGIAAVQAGDRDRAKQQWKRLAANLPADSDALPGLRQEIAALDGAPLAPQADASAPAAVAAAASAAPAANAPAATPGRAIEVRVRIDPALASQVAKGATLFVFARPANGSRMPLAIARLTVGDWPVAVRLDDSSSMMPGMALSNFPDIVIGARISQRGDATPGSGDLEALSPTLKQATIDAPVELLIDKVLP
ncbi:MAG: tetratricopeptide repeat protein [Lysobacterales bacterium]